MNFDKKLFRLAQKSTALLALAVVLGVLAALAMIFQARLLSRVISEAFLSSKDLNSLQPLIIGLIVVIVARAIAVFGSEVTASAAAIRIKIFLRENIVMQLFMRGPAGIDKVRSGELANLMTQAVEALDPYFSQYLPQLALSVLIPILVLAIVFPIDLLSAFILFVTGPLIPVFMYLIGKGAEAVTNRQFIALQRMSAYFLDILQGIAVLKSLNQSRSLIGQVADISRKFRETTMEVLRVTFISAFVLELVGTISTAIVAVQIGLRVLYLEMNFEYAFFILLLAPEFYFPLRQLGLRFHAAASGVAAADRIFQAIGDWDFTSPSAYKGSHPKEQVDEISFRNVTFQYSARANQKAGLIAGVSEVDLELRRGERVVLVGSSGSGKTTLSYLLLRFMEPQEGEILVDGEPIGEISPEIWRRGIAWVPQTPYLFAGTLAENIRLGSLHASDEDVKRAAQEAFLDEWIDSLPEGYQTLVGESGIGISGGQLQRIAIARAILKNAPVIIMDEPTSHLDAVLEAKVDQAITKLCSDRLVLIIAHQRKTIMNSHKVFVLDQGKVVQSGDPQWLLAQPGLFARLLQGSRGAQ